MSKFEYPMFLWQEIIQLLADSQITTVSDADLLHPDPDFMCNLYTRIFLHIMDANQEDHGQIEFGALEQLENPDSHAHSVQLVNLYNKIGQLIEVVHCPEAFTPKDLIIPEPERTLLFLSALLNFYLYRSSKLDQLTPISNDLNHFEERKLASEARISQLNAEVAECEEMRERVLPLVQEVNSKIKGLQQTVSGLNKHQMTLKTSNKQLKEKTKEMDEKISNAEFSLVQSVHENATYAPKLSRHLTNFRGLWRRKSLFRLRPKERKSGITNFSG